VPGGNFPTMAAIGDWEDVRQTGGNDKPGLVLGDAEDGRNRR
jgi:hypothetical protein